MEVEPRFGIKVSLVCLTTQGICNNSLIVKLESTTSSSTAQVNGNVSDALLWVCLYLIFLHREVD